MDRPDLLAAASKRLSFMEQVNLRFVRATFEPGVMARALPFLQRHLGSRWITLATNRLLHVHGTERLPAFDPAKSYLCVANHRSFFDMYVVTSWLVRRGLLKNRIVFPVRSGFFYDQAAGLVVNGAMSFFAMYPPIYREKSKAALNILALDELAWLLNAGGAFCGIHPEGTRKQDDDPYTFLPPQRGIGRLIQLANVPVIPVFVNGLDNDLKAQLTGGLRGTGNPIHVVFGEPIDFADLTSQGTGPKVQRAIAERVMDRIGELGQEEKRHRRGNPEA